MTAVSALTRKDVALFWRNRLFAVISVLSLVIYGAIYLLMPAEAESKFRVGVFPADTPPIVVAELEARAMEVVLFETEDALRAAVEGGDFRAGVVLSDEALAAIAASQQAQLTAYYPPGIPDELNQAFNDVLGLIFNEMIYTTSSQPLRIELDEEVLGYDLAGREIPGRDRLLPLFAVMLFMTETLGLANLIAEEKERGTLRALLATPMRLRELFASKGITGISLALAQAILLVALAGKLGIAPLLILTALLLGAALVTGIGFLVGAVSRDLMSVSGWGLLAILVLGLPSVALLFPGTVSDWVRLIPSFYLVDTLHRVINFGAGWQAMLPNLLILLAWSAAALTLGSAALRRSLS